MFHIIDQIGFWFAKALSASDTFFIILLALFNAYWFFHIRSMVKKVQDMFHPSSDKQFNVNPCMEWDNRQISELSDKRKKLVSSYTLYANFTAIFPLLGILGTVAALVTYTFETMMDSFMVALGTTLFGVFFAILFKGIDSFISGPIDILVDDINDIIRRFDKEMRAKDEV